MKRSIYLSPPHFLVFVSFLGVSGNFYVFFLTNSYILEKIKTSSNQTVFFFSFWNLKPHFLTGSHSLSLAVSLVVTRCHSLSLVATCCHSLPLVVPLIMTCCTTRCHSLYYSLSLVITCCATRCLSLSLDVSLVCLFINDL